MVTQTYIGKGDAKLHTQICHFCEIIEEARERERVVFEDESVVVIEDRKPKAPIHLLVLPKHHCENINELMLQYPETINAMLLFSQDYIGSQASLGETIFGLFIGTCPTHRHLHLQLLCGQELSVIADYTPGDGSGSGRIEYESPIVVRENKMTFPLDIISANGKRIVCKQCSSCQRILA